MFGIQVWIMGMSTEDQMKTIKTRAQEKRERLERYMKNCEKSSRLSWRDKPEPWKAD